MPRITSSALRSFRMHELRVLQPQSQSQYSSLAKPTIAASQSYKRFATTSTKSATSTGSSSSYKSASSTGSSSSYKPASSTGSSSSYKPASATTSTTGSSSSPAAKAPTSAYAAQQLDPVARQPYQTPPSQPPLPDAPALFSPPPRDAIDWSSSFHGLSTEAFPPEVASILMAPLPFEDVELKPDGIIYLPEIKYRRILNKAFGPGGWGMAPRGELAVGQQVVTREYALLVHGRFIASARGECAFFGNDDGIATAGEGCKSNALMRCCKDLGIASELWDPRYIREFKKKYTQDIWVEHVVTKKKRILTVRKGEDPSYPYKRT